MTGKQCFGVFLANKTQCPYCQWVKPTPKGREIKQTEGELTEFDKEQFKLKLFQYTQSVSRLTLTKESGTSITICKLAPLFVLPS